MRAASVGKGKEDQGTSAERGTLESRSIAVGHVTLSLDGKYKYKYK